MKRQRRRWVRASRRVGALAALALWLVVMQGSVERLALSATPTGLLTLVVGVLATGAVLLFGAGRDATRGGRRTLVASTVAIALLVAPSWFTS